MVPFSFSSLCLFFFFVSRSNLGIFGFFRSLDCLIASPAAAPLVG